jgi:hypothetical protein
MHEVTMPVSHFCLVVHPITVRSFLHIARTHARVQYPDMAQSWIDDLLRIATSVYLWHVSGQAITATDIAGILIVSHFQSGLMSAVPLLSLTEKCAKYCLNT